MVLKNGRKKRIVLRAINTFLSIININIVLIEGNFLVNDSLFSTMETGIQEIYQSWE